MAIKSDIEMYSTYKEGKPAVAERTLQNKIDKYMNSCIFDIVNKYYYNTYHSEIKMKPVDVRSSLYTTSGKDINDEDPKFKAGDIFRKSKYCDIFVRGHVPNWFEEVFVITKT